MTGRGLPTAIVNGRVFTADASQPWAQAVSVLGSRIEAVGTVKDVTANLDGAEIVDVGGRTVVPGFVDAHNHFLATGESLASLDVRFPKVGSIADLVGAISAAASSASAGAPVRAFGYDDAKYERPPTRWDLDAAAPRNPVYVGHVSGHYVLVNSSAMALTGVTDATGDPPGGQLDRDGGGRPTGIFRDTAMGIVEPTAVDIGHHGPNFHVAARPGELQAAIESAGRAFVAAGLTTVCDAQVTVRELRAYREARRQGTLALRTVCMPLSHQLEDYERLGLAGPFGDEWLAIGPMKFYCDGSLIGGTAAFAGDTAGVLYWDGDALAQAVVRAHAGGWQVGVHAQGDRAIELVLDAFERAARAYPASDARHRIEHAGCPTAAQLGRMHDLGVVMVTQPNYLRDSGDDFLERFGARAHRFQPLREALDAGVRVVVSSDSDVTSFRPLDTIASAVERQTLSGAVVGPHQRLTVQEAMLAHTAEAAFALRMEHQVGSITPGKLADLVVLEGDPFHAEPGSIRDMSVSMTMIGGRVAHCTL